MTRAGAFRPADQFSDRTAAVGGCDPSEGRLLGKDYRILQRIKDGDTGVVFEAEHVRLGRRVAIKMPRPRAEPSLGARVRLEREAEALSRIAHPHVVSVIDYGVTDATEPYLVLELLRGETLEDRLDKQSPLALGEAVEITLQVAAALDAAHRAGVVHTDVRPSNIFITSVPGEQSFVKLLDFGGSQHVDTGRAPATARAGTPDYVAPDGATGRWEPFGMGGDQRALAAIAYEMLTGKRPSSRIGWGDASRRSTPEVPRASSVAPWLSAEVAEVLERGLSENSATHFDDVFDFARILSVAATGIRARPSEPIAGSVGLRAQPSEPPAGSTRPHPESNQTVTLRSVMPVATNNELSLLRHCDTYDDPTGWEMICFAGSMIVKAARHAASLAIRRLAARAPISPSNYSHDSIRRIFARVKPNRRTAQ